MQITFEPLETFPRRSTVNRKSGGKFQAGYPATLQKLQYELGKLRARNIVIQLGLERADIRLDGLPRSNAKKPSHPGIVLSFASSKGDLRFLCDTYTDWKANLRAIAMLLERLRLLDIDGVAQDDEPYRGWQALPPAPLADTSFTEQTAAEYIASFSSVGSIPILTVKERFQQAYREAARKVHPDTGGNHLAMQRLNEAAAILKARFGL